MPVANKRNLRDEFEIWLYFVFHSLTASVIFETII